MKLPNKSILYIVGRLNLRLVHNYCHCKLFCSTSRKNYNWKYSATTNTFEIIFVWSDSYPESNPTVVLKGHK